MEFLHLLCCALRLKGSYGGPTLLFLTSYCLLTLLVVPNQAMGCNLTPSNCVEGVTTFNPSTNCCDQCSSCQGHEKMRMISQCNVTHDAVCDCLFPTYLDDTSGMPVCALECDNCPSGDCLPSTGGRPACRCLNQDCHLPGDIYCERPNKPHCSPSVIEPSSEAPGRQSNGGLDQDSVPPWGIGLIAVGIVIGIIIFASCFLFLGIITMHKNSDPESQRGSESSENGLVPRDSFSSMGTKTSYVSSSSSMYPYLSSHSMLELLKSSNSQLLTSKDKLSSVQSSPVSARSSPKPGGTVRLAKNSTTDKLTAIVL